MYERGGCQMQRIVMINYESNGLFAHLEYQTSAV